VTWTLNQEKEEIMKININKEEVATKLVVNVISCIAAYLLGLVYIKAMYAMINKTEEKKSKEIDDWEE
jgi:hypothetical protein